MQRPIATTRLPGMLLAPGSRAAPRRCAAAPPQTPGEADRAAPLHRLQQTPEERMAAAKPLLAKAEGELAEYCSLLPGETEEAERCWAAYDYFEQRKEEAESGCEVDWSSGARSGPACGKLEAFEGVVRQLLGQAPMRAFAHMLWVLRRAEAHARAGKPSAEAARAEAADSSRRRLTALFHGMDSDGNGKLDAAEFRAALERISQGRGRLSGATVGTILSAMDLHGSIGLEDFLRIVEAEEIHADSPYSRWLRAHRSPSKYWGEPLEAA